MKVYLVYGCKLGTKQATVESIWTNEKKAEEHAERWERTLTEYHFWVEDRELRK